MIEQTFEISCILQTREGNSVVESFIRQQGDARHLDLDTLTVVSAGSFGRKHLVVRTKPVATSEGDIIRRISAASNGYVQGTPVVTVVPSRARTLAHETATSHERDDQTFTDEMQLIREFLRNFSESTVELNASGCVVINTHCPLTSIFAD